MNYSNLRELYPDVVIAKEEANPQKYLSLYNGEDFFIIPLTSLKHQEIVLLRSVFPLKPHDDPWFQFIMGKASIPYLVEGNYRIFFFSLQTASNSKIWLDVMMASFESCLAAHFIDENEGFLIVCDDALNVSYLEGILSALEADLAISASLYLSPHYFMDESFPTVFHANYHYFRKIRHLAKVTTFATTFVPAMVVPSLKSSTIIQNYQNQFNEIDQFESLIVALWKHQANITSAASELFLHRNTLNYRIDKFYEAVGLNLRNLDDLLLAYLIIQ